MVLFIDYKAFISGSLLLLFVFSTIYIPFSFEMKKKGRKFLFFFICIIVTLIGFIYQEFYVKTTQEEGPIFVFLQNYQMLFVLILISLFSILYDKFPPIQRGLEHFKTKFEPWISSKKTNLIIFGTILIFGVLFLI